MTNCTNIHPQVIIENDRCIITDNSGGKVTLKAEQVDELIDEYYRLTKTPEEIKYLREARINCLILSNVRNIIKGEAEGVICNFQFSSDFILGANKKKK